MKTVTTILFLLALTLGYSTFRYHLVGNADWSWFALWTTNKAISWTATALLALAYLVQDKAEARRLGLTGFFLMAWHGGVSLFLLSPVHYAKLYSGDSLTALSFVSMLLGGAGAAAFCLPAWASRGAVKAELGFDRWLLLQRLGYAGLALTALHCLAIGLSGWLTPSKWQGGLPPITLLGFLTALLPMVRLTRRPN
jgi:DMSO/TMAO reductase YedYZ heme-binding membrane subunit